MDTGGLSMLTHRHHSRLRLMVFPFKELKQVDMKTEGAKCDVNETP